ncbi:MAG: TetR/AcrR family transcriptional regulator [Solirubrobacteraceae bacterium]|jgi:AcrR family transcriptional regulator
MAAKRVTNTIRQRREPVQARSRETVGRILEAAAELIEAEGLDAVTTRAIAERAGVSAPSLYRFFADRDEIFDRLLSTQLAELDRRAEAAEATWEIASARDFVSRELDLHLAYYEKHPSFVRLWFGGRISPTVVAEVHRRNRTLALRARSTLAAAGLVDPSVSESAFVLLVELGDRALELAFRNRRHADREVIAHGRDALCSYLESIPTPSA